jgi:hypothetical protein
MSSTNSLNSSPSTTRVKQAAEKVSLFVVAGLLGRLALLAEQVAELLAELLEVARGLADGFDLLPQAAEPERELTRGRRGCRESIGPLPAPQPFELRVTGALPATRAAGGSRPRGGRSAP